MYAMTDMCSRWLQLPDTMALNVGCEQLQLVCAHLVMPVQA